jgi:hypothetical protein
MIDVMMAINRRSKIRNRVGRSISSRSRGRKRASAKDATGFDSGLRPAVGQFAASDTGEVGQDAYQMKGLQMPYLTAPSNSKIDALVERYAVAHHREVFTLG